MSTLSKFVDSKTGSIPARSRQHLKQALTHQDHEHLSDKRDCVLFTLFLTLQCRRNSNLDFPVIWLAADQM